MGEEELRSPLLDDVKLVFTDKGSTTVSDFVFLFYFIIIIIIINI